MNQEQLSGLGHLLIENEVTRKINADNVIGV